MKRSTHLTRLSWDHHAALIVASRILRGLEHGADPAMIAAYAQHIWERWLLRHNRLEEELLESPLARLPLDPRMRQRLLGEHEEMERLTAKLWERGERLPGHLGEFAGTLRNHVRFEEQQLFPTLERLLPIEEMERIGGALHSEYEAPETGWSELFWE